MACRHDNNGRPVAVRNFFTNNSGTIKMRHIDAISIIIGGHIFSDIVTHRSSVCVTVAMRYSMTMGKCFRRYKKTGSGTRNKLNKFVHLNSPLYMLDGMMSHFIRFFIQIIKIFCITFSVIKLLNDLSIHNLQNTSLELLAL